MILLIDIGNSRVKYTLFDRPDVRSITKIHTIDNMLFNERYIHQLCSEDYQVKQVVFASVANADLIQPLSRYCGDNNISYKQIKSEKSKNSITSGYEAPEKLGVDRWLAIIGAQQIYPKKNILVIDAGTATTFDVVDLEGQHHGGWIFAGISTLFTSLLENTAHINVDVNKNVDLSFGLNTTDNVNNCCWAATVGLIHQAIIQGEEKLGSIDHIIITGGNAQTLQILCNKKLEYIESLIFYGLQQYVL